MPALRLSLGPARLAGEEVPEVSELQVGSAEEMKGSGRQREEGEMKYFKLKYADGTWEIVSAPNALTLIRQRDLGTREHVTTRIIELNGEQEAIARSNHAAEAD